jgi:tetratricopeptide (TPR) repeat protein/predicted Ser/Thr protein kinase
MSPRIGHSLLHYHVLDKIGQGGMGQVFRAQDRKLGRHVALKVLAPAVAADEKSRLRLLREARAVSALNHPNIVTVHAIEEAEGLDFIVMELVDGESLKQMLARGPMDPSTLIDLAAQAASGLAAAHAAGIIHRDIKPANLIVTRSGVLKILDFGLAKPMISATGETEAELTAPGAVAGTVAYMSPEQLRGEPLDPRTDLFSLGAVLYEAATGRQPFTGAHLPELISAILAGSPSHPSAIRAGLGAAFDQVVLRALAADREARYPSAEKLREDLRALASGTIRSAMAASEGPAEPEGPPPILVGRDRELERLDQRAASAARGSGGLVFITGEPGIGKTALASEFLRRSRLQHSSPIVARGRCVEQYGTGEAYLPFLDAVGEILAGPRREQARAALRSAAPTWCLQLPAVFGAEVADLQRETIGATKDRMMREMGDALAALAAAAPVLLLLEDLHWADPATVDLLRHLCQRLDSRRILIVGTFRLADIEARDHPLKTYRLEMQAHGLCEEIALSQLSESDVAGYLEARFPAHQFPSGLAALLYARTEGHALFVTGLAGLLAERGDIAVEDGAWRLLRPLAELNLDAPQSVVSMISKQLETLAEEDRQALQCASVQGEEFLSTVLAASLGVDEMAAEERMERLAREQRLVRALGEEELPDGSFAVRYRFAHALYQNVLYDDLLARRRVQLHRQTGERIENHYGDQAPRVAAQLAVHFERGREYRRSIDYLLHAGDTAATRCANAQALEYFNRAMELVEKLPEGERPARKIQVHRKRMLAQLSLSRFADAENECRNALAVARAIGDEIQQVHVLNVLAQVLFWQHRLTLMGEATAEAVSIAERCGDERLLLDAMTFRGAGLHAIGELTAAVALLDRCVERGRALQHRSALAAGLTWRGSVYNWQADYASAESCVREARPLTVESRNAVWLGQATFGLGISLANQGRISEALATLEGGLELFDRNGAPYNVARFANTVGWIYREAGWYARALEFDSKGVEYGRKYKIPEAEISSLINLTREMTRTGDYSQARETFALIEEMAARDEWHRWLFLIRYRATAARHWLAERNYDRAAAALAVLRDDTARHGIRKYAALARLVAGEIEAERGDLHAAEQELLDAQATLGDRPAPLAAWRIQAALGRVRHRRGDVTGSRVAFAEAAAIVDRIAAGIDDAELRSGFLASDDARAVREMR